MKSLQSAVLAVFFTLSAASPRWPIVGTSLTVSHHVHMQVRMLTMWASID